MRSLSVAFLTAVLVLAAGPRGSAGEENSSDADADAAPAWTDLVLRDTLRGSKGWVRCLAFHPSTQMLVSGSADGMLRIWDPGVGVLDAEVRVYPRPGPIP